MMMIAERRKEERSGIHDFHSKWETKTTVIFVNQTIEHVYVCVNSVYMHDFALFMS